MIILIHPPVAKPCEPPAGIAKLSGMLGMHGVEHRVLDANVEGLLHLAGQPAPRERVDDAWTKRAFRHVEQNISSMRDARLYRNLDRYSRAVSDIGRVLSTVSPAGAAVGLTNYEHRNLSPLKSGDLLTAAEEPELDPFYPFFRPRLLTLVREKSPSVVGISLNYLSQAFCAFSIAGFIRREFPGVKIIFGGGLVTSWLKNPQWKDPFTGLVDYFVPGPGEYQLLSLLGRDIKEGVSPVPEYGFMPNDLYLSPGFILPYSASRGCYWNRCSFCPEKAEENPYAPIPVQRVLSDLAFLAGETGPRLIHFLDNAISPAFLNALSAGNTVGPWYGFARIGPHLADFDFCAALKRSGCIMLKLGIESGDQRVLDALQKGISVEMASASLKNLKRAGIATYVYLIFGTPPETDAGAEKTLDFTIRHRHWIDFLNLAIFNMPVCGKTAPGIRTRNFSEGDLSLYTDFSHPNGWDRKRVRIFLENEFRRHPAISAILKNDPPVFTSNHAPFFMMGHENRNAYFAAHRAWLIGGEK